jgi:hypothetical protein
MDTPETNRIDRRLAIKWILAAGAGAALARPFRLSGADPAEDPAPAPHGEGGYGTDPSLMKEYKPGDYWPLTLTQAQRRDVAALCDLIVPAEGSWPSASSVGVVDFVDEWVSAPYPGNVEDRKTITDGLAWVASESAKRFGGAFAAAGPAQQGVLCEEMAAPAPEASAMHPVSRFFRRLRDLTASGYFTTPVGMKDLGYVGNVPLAKFDGPPADLVARMGLADEVKW